MPKLPVAFVISSVVLVFKFFFASLWAATIKSSIEDLIVAAHNEAKKNLKTKTTEEITKATGNFGIPGFKWPF